MTPSATTEAEAAAATADLTARIRAAGVPVGTGQAVDAATGFALMGASGRAATTTALVAILAAASDEAEVIRPIVARWLDELGGEEDPELGISLPGSESAEPDEAEQAGDAEVSVDEATTRDVDELPENGLGETRRDDQAGADDRSRVSGSDDADATEETDDDGDELTASPWSAVEILRRRRFDDYSDDDLDRAAVYLASLPPLLPRRPLRRLRPASGGDVLDLRRTLAASVRTHGEPLVRSYRRRTTGPRRVVILIDVSGSMERWSPPLLLFLHAAIRASRHVEGFAFGTRLTRLTRALDVRRPTEALARAAATVPDWSGGTLIGENLDAFNRLYGRRGATREAAVVIISDGWERGDTERLRAAMAELRRSAHSIVWANPLAGSEGYQPLVAGLVAALEYVDVFLPGHDLEAIESLVGILRALPERRGGQGARWCPSARTVGSVRRVSYGK